MWLWLVTWVYGIEYMYRLIRISISITCIIRWNWVYVIRSLSVCTWVFVNIWYFQYEMGCKYFKNMRSRECVRDAGRTVTNSIMNHWQGTYCKKNKAYNSSKLYTVYIYIYFMQGWNISLVRSQWRVNNRNRVSRIGQTLVQQGKCKLWNEISKIQHLNREIDPSR